MEELNKSFFILHFCSEAISHYSECFVESQSVALAY